MGACLEGRGRPLQSGPVASPDCAQAGGACAKRNLGLGRLVAASGGPNLPLATQHGGSVAQAHGNKQILWRARAVHTSTRQETLSRHTRMQSNSSHVELAHSLPLAIAKRVKGQGSASSLPSRPPHRVDAQSAGPHEPADVSEQVMPSALPSLGSLLQDTSINGCEMAVPTELSSHTDCGLWSWGCFLGRRGAGSLGRLGASAAGRQAGHAWQKRIECGQRAQGDAVVGEIVDHSGSGSWVALTSMGAPTLAHPCSEVPRWLKGIPFG